MVFSGTCPAVRIFHEIARLALSGIISMTKQVCGLSLGFSTVEVGSIASARSPSKVGAMPRLSVSEPGKAFPGSNRRSVHSQRNKSALPVWRQSVPNQDGSRQWGQCIAICMPVYNIIPSILSYSFSNSFKECFPLEMQEDSLLCTRNLGTLTKRSIFR